MNKARIRRLMAVAFATIAALAVGVQAANVVYLTNDKVMQAKSVTWRESTQEYRVEMPDGSIIPFAKNQVDHLEIEKPPDFDKAVKMVATKQFDAAIPVLEEIVTKFKMLMCDNEARRVLAEAYLGKGDPKKAVMTLDELFTSVTKAQAPADVLLLYWKALLGAERTSTLNKELEEATAGANREMAAAAMIMRGNMKRQAGQKQDALFDYLRVVILCDQIKSVQPEAIFRAAELMEELRDPRAEEMRKKLVKEYGNSEYARSLHGKI